MNEDVYIGCGNQKFKLSQCHNVVVPIDKADNELTIDQLKEVKEQYCKYKCKNKDAFIENNCSGCGLTDDGDNFCDHCQINNFIEELYQNGLLKI